MNLDFKSTDSLIFDMDGTLWDATDSYAAVWNASFEHFGLAKRITRDDLCPYMGMTLDRIIAGLLKDQTIDAPAFIADLHATEQQLMPRLGGRPFPGLRQGLEQLSSCYRLFMVSNCGRYGLRDFGVFTGTSHCFTATLSHGQNPVPKSENIGRIISQYLLQAPVYVGDTQSDCDQAHRAGVPFVFAAYGFGCCSDPDASFSSFQDLVEFFMSIKQQ